MNHPFTYPSLETPGTLRERAVALRNLILRVHAVAGRGHLGSSLSIVEILTALLAGPLSALDWGIKASTGDRLVLSKGHAALGLYCALAQIGILDPSALASFGQDGGELEPHPNETVVPCLHASTGSLGQGLSIGLGLAYGSRLAGRHHERVAVILGDGELNEGQIWEAAQAATTLKLGALLAVIDANRLQQDGPVDEIMPVTNVATMFASLGWRVAEADGHNVDSLVTLFEEMWPPRDSHEGQPSLVVAHTVKGRGVPHLEGKVESHYPPPLSLEELALIEWMTARE